MKQVRPRPRIKFIIFPLHSFPFICYKQFTESRCVAAGVFCCISRHRPASKDLKRECRFSIVPATGLHSERNFSKGNLQSKEPPKVSSFLNFLSSVSGCAKCTPNLAFYPDRKAILLRAIRARPQNQKACHSKRPFREESAFWVSLAALLFRSRFPMWKSSGNHSGNLVGSAR